MLSDIDGNKLLTTKEGGIMQQVKLAIIYSETFPNYVSVSKNIGIYVEQTLDSEKYSDKSQIKYKRKIETFQWL